MLVVLLARWITVARLLQLTNLQLDLVSGGRSTHTSVHYTQEREHTECLLLQRRRGFSESACAGEGACESCASSSMTNHTGSAHRAPAAGVPSEGGRAASSGCAAIASTGD